MSARYEVVGETLVQWTDQCTCGGSGIASPAHQPGCGSEPVGPVDQAVDDALAVLAAAGWKTFSLPDHPIRHVLLEPLERAESKAEVAS